MSVALHGWVEVRDGGSRAHPNGVWSGFLALHHLVGSAHALFPLLHQCFPTTGPRALRYELSEPANPSHELNYLLEEAGVSLASCFDVAWSELEPLATGARAFWPRLDIELWWRDADGNYQLKSRAHQLSRLNSVERSAAMTALQPFDKRQYRYVVHQSLTPIDVPAEWQLLLAAMRHAAATHGGDNVRLAGFFE